MKISVLSEIYIKKLEKAPIQKREIFNFLYSKMQHQNISLVGLRQIGKSTLAEQLMLKYYDEEIKDKTSIDRDLFYINLTAFESDELLNVNENLHVHLSIDKFKVVLIDEAHLLPNWTRVLQSLIDLNKKTKFIFTGSSARHLTEQVVVNRIFSYYVNPLSFNDYKKIWNDNDFTNYLYWGSFPKMSSYDNVKIQYLEQVKSNVIDKIIYNESRISVDPDKFYKSLHKIKNYIGNEINKNEIAQSASIHRSTLNDYISIMIDSRLVQYISNIEDNNKNQKTKIYLNDKSMINYLTQDNTLNSNDIGALVENLVFNYLDDKYNRALHDHKVYYLKAKSEIDFIVPSDKLLIEVKYRTNNINWFDLTKDLNNQIPPKFKDYKKILITKDQSSIVNGWTLVELKDWLEQT